ncbi:MAG TPA: hypothetical protein VEH27_07890 [Methylomirabilota bacterium]|nr:hypothetical protein [Methylomirabilota bacterium]
MFPHVHTNDPLAVRREVTAICASLFPSADPRFIDRAFGWAIDAFEGRYLDYLPIDARYHDLEHTMQGTLCFARLMDGYIRAGAEPTLTPEFFELCLLAILMHDTGYLKHAWDKAGTGAKYTSIHVQRSADFAAQLMLNNGYSAEAARAVQHMIRCTGVNLDLRSIPFQSRLERRMGCALGTSDLLGQMAAVDYIDKLPILYTEFAESAQYDSRKVTGPGSFSSADDLIRRTPKFWENYVKPKINQDFEGLFRYLNAPYPDGPNPYVEAIEANIARLQIS